MVADNAPQPAAVIHSAAFCAVVKSTYRPVKPPTNDSCSIYPNHAGRSAGSPSTDSNTGSSAARSSKVSFT